MLCAPSNHREILDGIHSCQNTVHKALLSILLHSKNKERWAENVPLSQSCAVAKISGGPLAKQTWQRMEDCYTGVSAKLWKPLLRSAVCMQSFDCPVAHQNILLLATAHDCYPSVSQVSVKVHLINNCFISYTLFVCLFVCFVVCLFVCWSFS